MKDLLALNLFSGEIDPPHHSPLRIERGHQVLNFLVLCQKGGRLLFFRGDNVWCHVKIRKHPVYDEECDLLNANQC